MDPSPFIPLPSEGERESIAQGVCFVDSLLNGSLDPAKSAEGIGRRAWSCVHNQQGETANIERRALNFERGRMGWGNYTLALKPFAHIGGSYKSY